jgi:hypothetical protein
MLGTGPPAAAMGDGASDCSGSCWGEGEALQWENERDRRTQYEVIPPQRCATAVPATQPCAL